MLRLQHLLCTVTLAAVHGPPAAAEDLATAESDIVGQWADVDTITARVDMTLEMVPGMTTTGTGTLEYLRTGDVEKYRMDMTSTTIFGDQTVSASQTLVSDGSVVHMLMEQLDHKMVTRRSAGDHSGRPGGARMFEELKREHDLELLPGERIAGEPAWVIEAVPRSGRSDGFARTRMSFSRDSGMMLKMVGLDAGGKALMTWVYRDIRINGAVDPGRFVVDIPEDVPVFDQTRP